MVTLHDIMSLDVETVSPEATLREVAALFADKHITGAPVVSGEKVLGVVSATDLVEFDAESSGVPRRREEQVEWGDITEPEEWTEGEESPSAFFVDLWGDAGAETGARLDETDGPEWNVLEEHTVGEVMTRTLCALPPTASARDAAKYMLRAGVHRILVMEDAVLVGVVTMTDIVKAVAQHGLGG